jgi:hypothetical protein
MRTRREHSQADGGAVRGGGSCRSRGWLAVPAVAVALGGLLTTAGVATAGPTTVACTQSAFDAAVKAGGTVVFGANCTITLTKTVNIPASLTVSIESGGNTVDLSGDDSVRLFSVAGGSLTISGITLSQGVVTGKTGKGGSNGADGVTGANGAPGSSSSPGGPGQNGTKGGAGTAGAAGGSAEGGGIDITSGTVDLQSVTLELDAAVAGSGGEGGIGGVGGSGGVGGGGGTGSGTSAGTNGGNGGNGGVAGDGGKGGKGGVAEGGAIYNAGSLTLTNCVFASDDARAGGGGFGEAPRVATAGTQAVPQAVASPVPPGRVASPKGATSTAPGR